VRPDDSGLFGSVGAADAHGPLVTLAYHLHAPGIAADLAVLHERTGHIRLEVNLHLFAAVRTAHAETIVHETIINPPGMMHRRRLIL